MVSAILQANDFEDTIGRLSLDPKTKGATVLVERDTT